MYHIDTIHTLHAHIYYTHTTCTHILYIHYIHTYTIHTLHAHIYYTHTTCTHILYIHYIHTYTIHTLHAHIYYTCSAYTLSLTLLHQRKHLADSERPSALSRISVHIIMNYNTQMKNNCNKFLQNLHVQKGVSTCKRLISLPAGCFCAGL